MCLAACLINLETLVAEIEYDLVNDFSDLI